MFRINTFIWQCRADTNGSAEVAASTDVAPSTGVAASAEAIYIKLVIWQCRGGYGTAEGLHMAVQCASSGVRCRVPHPMIKLCRIPAVAGCASLRPCTLPHTSMHAVFKPSKARETAPCNLFRPGRRLNVDPAR